MQDACDCMKHAITKKDFSKADLDLLMKKCDCMLTALLVLVMMLSRLPVILGSEYFTQP